MNAYTFITLITLLVAMRLIENNKLSDDSVLVRFLASPINPSDFGQIEGTYPVKPEKFPAVGGNEGVGRIEEVGKNVKEFQRGDLVVPAVSGLGCWRDYACLQPESLIKIPAKWAKSLPIEVLATINVNPPTAYRLLSDFVDLKRGDLIVQNGANSAVGRLVIQMASIKGFRTLNIIRDRPDFDALSRELSQLDPSGGASVIKVEDLKDAKGMEAKLGLNCVGGGAVAEMSKVMTRQSGVIVTYGAMSRRPLTVPASPLIFQDLTLKGFWLTAWYRKTPVTDPLRSKMFQDLLAWYSEGLLQPVKSFWLDPESESGLREFIKDSWEGKISDKGKCILKFGE